MAVYFMGAEVEDFVVVSGTPTNVTTAAYFASGNARGAINLAAAVLQGLRATITPVGELWFHANIAFHTNSAMNGSPTPSIRFMDSTGANGVGIKWSASNTTIGSGMQVQKYQSAAWSTLATGGAFTADTGNDHVWDVYVKLGNPGTVRIYRDGGLYYSDTALNLSHFTNIERIEIYSQNSNGGCAFSEIIVADWVTVGGRLVTKAPDAAGTYSQWTGAYTAIDEVIASTDYINEDTVDQRFSFTCGDFSALAAGEVIEAVKLTMWGFKGASGPTSANLFSRRSSTDYDQSDQALSATAATISHTFTVDPVTTAAWTVTNLNATEFGIRART